MISTRRSFVGRAAAAALGGALAPGDAFSTGPRCPPISGKTVRWIVPFSPGGGYDIYARLLEPYLEARLDASIAIENRAGAAGMVGARALRRAAPDGLTLGILNATGLLLASLDDPGSALDPVEDFTILGRVARTPNIWATGARSGLRRIEDLFATAATRPVVVAVTEVSSNNFVSVTVGAALMRIDLDYVAGFAGTRESSLALLRGDADLASFTFDSVRDRIDNGDLVPVLQVADRAVAEHASLRGVPVLAGPNGLAIRRAAQLGTGTTQARDVADALAAFLGAGRVIAAPPGLPASTKACLDRTLQEVLASEEFAAVAARANRPIDAATAADAAADVVSAANAAPRLVAIVREAIRRIRGRPMHRPDHASVTGP